MLSVTPLLDATHASAAGPEIAVGAISTESSCFLSFASEFLILRAACCSPSRLPAELSLAFRSFICEVVYARLVRIWPWLKVATQYLFQSRSSSFLSVFVL